MVRKVRSWFSSLSKASKAGVIIALLFVVGAAASPDSTQQNTPIPESKQTSQSTEEAATGAKAETTEKEIITETETIPFKKIVKEDNSLDKGKTVLQSVGVNGTKTFTYEVTFTNGTETNKELIGQEITTQPIHEVTLVGTYVHASPDPKQSANCHPSYTGSCVPITSDVDCAGGSGNGPAYTGMVTLVGPDVYDLDRDNDGYGCE